MSDVLSAEEILALPAALGGSLPADVVARLPETTPPAPWHSPISMAVWSLRAAPAAAAATPAPLRPSLRLGAAAFISYHGGAVGTYRELLTTPCCVTTPGRRRPVGHVPFIAVDSVPSIHGGRTNWALPKVLAAFAGEPAEDRRLSAEGDGWVVRARVRARGPWLPFRAGGACAQPWPDGSVRTFHSTFAGRARLAVLRVAVDGPPGLEAALPAGRHLGLLVRGRVDVGAPR